MASSASASTSSSSSPALPSPARGDEDWERRGPHGNADKTPTPTWIPITLVRSDILVYTLPACSRLFDLAARTDHVRTRGPHHSPPESKEHDPAGVHPRRVDRASATPARPPTRPRSPEARVLVRAPTAARRSARTCCTKPKAPSCRARRTHRGVPGSDARTDPDPGRPGGRREHPALRPQGVHHRDGARRRGRVHDRRGRHVHTRRRQRASPSPLFYCAHDADRSTLQTEQFARRVRYELATRMPVLSSRIHRTLGGSVPPAPDASASTPHLQRAEGTGELEWSWPDAERRLEDAYERGGFGGWADAALREVEDEGKVERARRGLV